MDDEAPLISGTERLMKCFSSLDGIVHFDLFYVRICGLRSVAKEAIDDQSLPVKSFEEKHGPHYKNMKLRGESLLWRTGLVGRTCAGRRSVVCNHSEGIIIGSLHLH